MLKKVLLLVLALVLALSLAACAQQPTTAEPPNNDQQTPNDQQSGGNNNTSAAETVYDWNFLSDEGLDKNNMTQDEIDSLLAQNPLRWEIYYNGLMRLKGVCTPNMVPTFYDETDQPWHDFTTLQSNDAADGRPALKRVIVEPTVMALPNFAFTNCAELESISLPMTLTEIPAYCFTGCKALTTVSGGLGIITIGEQALSGCIKLARIELSDSLTTVKTGAFQSAASSLGTTNTGIPKVLSVYFSATDERWLSCDGIKQAVEKGAPVEISSGNSAFLNAKIFYSN